MANHTLQPRDAAVWANWFWAEFFPDWLARVQDGTMGVFDALDAQGNPDTTTGKSLLAQARTLFTVSHVALLSGDPTLIAAARQQGAFLERFRKAPGLYRCRANRDGSPTGQTADEIARSYDHSFVILGLATWNKLSPSPDVELRIEECWEALQSQLTDPSTGLLHNDDTGSDTGPAQNPHMHLYEACLQAYRMTERPVWVERATKIGAHALPHFMDKDSGSIAEFMTADLHPLPGPAGKRREIGHQCEWAWLLLEEASFTDAPTLHTLATRLMDFANAHGFAPDGPLKGAAYDAVSTTGEVVENSFLLWPQTETIKVLANHYMAGDFAAGPRAQALFCLMFERWFEGHTSFINQLDADGNCIWPQGLTRLMYHVVLAMTVGADAGLWPQVPRHASP